MPDSPDYQKYLPGSVRFSLQDMGELAARLGSPIIFDRRGDLVYFDTFNNGLGDWAINLSGTGAEVALEADKGWKYPYHIRMTAGTNGQKYAFITKYICAWLGGKMGIESNWMFQLAADYTRFYIDVYDGVNYSNIVLRYTHASGIWAVRTGITTYEDVLTIPIDVSVAYMYVPVKIVFDLDTGKYVRLMVSDNLVDLGNLSFFQTPSTNSPKFMITIYHVGNGSNNPVLRVSHIILTANEP